MLTINEYNKLSPARRKYIEKQAKKKGSSIKDYLVKNGQKRITPEQASKHQQKLMGENAPTMSLDDIVEGFSPDFGIKASQINKNEYRMDMAHFANEVFQTSLFAIPSRENEFTCDVPFEGTMYKGTFQLSPMHRQQIADTMSKGHMGFTIKFKPLGKIQTAHEWIRLLKIQQIIPSPELYRNGGNFSVMNTKGRSTFKLIALSFANPMIMETA